MDFSRITVVSQGPITPLTKASLKSVRKYLPESHIILSTWEGSDIEGLEFDEIVYSKDPYSNDRYYPSNLNRMLLSTLNGLKRVRSEFTLKMRTDFCLTGTNFINLFQLKLPEPKEYKVFKNRIVAYVWKSKPGRLFNIGDFHFFGYTSDIISLFDIPPMADRDFFWLKVNPPTNRFFLRRNTNRFHPEQYIWISFLRKNNIDLKLADYTDYTFEKKVMSEKIFVNNVIFASFYEFSIITWKANLLSFNLPVLQRGYDFDDWISLCKKYIKSDYEHINPIRHIKLYKSIILCSFLLFGKFLSCLLPQRKSRQKVRKYFEKISLNFLLNGKL